MRNDKVGQEVVDLGAFGAVCRVELLLFPLWHWNLDVVVRRMLGLVILLGGLLLLRSAFLNKALLVLAALLATLMASLLVNMGTAWRREEVLRLLLWSVVLAMHLIALLAEVARPGVPRREVVVVGRWGSVEVHQRTARVIG